MVEHERMNLNNQMNNVNSMISLIEARMMSFQPMQGPEKNGHLLLDSYTIRVSPHFA